MWDALGARDVCFAQILSIVGFSRFRFRRLVGNCTGDIIEPRNAAEEITLCVLPPCGRFPQLSRLLPQPPRHLPGSDHWLRQRSNSSAVGARTRMSANSKL